MNRYSVLTTYHSTELINTNVMISVPNNRILRTIIDDNTPYLVFEAPDHCNGDYKITARLSTWSSKYQTQFEVAKVGEIEEETNCKIYEDDQIILIFIIETGSLLKYDKISNDLLVLNDNEEMLIVDVNRSIRLLFFSLLEKVGAICIHGSAGVKEGRVIIFAGHSGNGKSTNLLETMKSFGFDPLSFDTVFLRRDKRNEYFEVYGWPTTCNLSLGTLSDFEELAAFYPPEFNHLSYSDRHSSPYKVSLDAKAVVDAFGMKIVPNGQLDTIVFVNFQAVIPIGVTRIREMEEINRRLLDNYISGEKQYPQFHMLWNEKPNQDLQNIFNEKLSETEIYLLNWGGSPSQMLRQAKLFE